MRRTICTVVALALVSACSARLSVDVLRFESRSSGAVERALATYARTLDLYCTAGELTPARCQQQRTQLALVPAEPGPAIAALESGLGEAGTKAADHLRVLAANLREACRTGG